MIERYAKSDFKLFWNDKAKFDAMLKIEVLNCEALKNKGIIPDSDYIKIKEHAKFDINRINEFEQQTGHDVIAFVKSVNESLGLEKRWIHYGLTSTDVVDTAYGVMFKNANDYLITRLDKFISTLKEKAIQYKDTPCIGRTHGVHAEITSFGLKWAVWYDDMKRIKKQFEDIRNLVECGKISGAVGNHANVEPDIQDFICNSLGIHSAQISTQVLSRDRHASYINVIALIATNIEKIATEIRNLQRTEINEVQEPFSQTQKGSSAMPHKKNPIISENMTGIARVIRGYATTCMQDVVLWHERDISHSSVERIIMPDATILLEYMLSRYTKVILNLNVNEKQMLHNINITNGVIYSQRVLTLMIENGFDRLEAYDIIQKLSIKALESNDNLKDLLMENEKITHKINIKELNDCFTNEYYLRQVDTIYKRVGI